ncbi:MAG TPA: cellulose biosynthesis protein BcsG [Comamonadaceae bacterium]|uniref:cellulose biosynthesis protein BcsG n=1 Tax=Pulveribacter sp. TaxID=2678893 RepID=UPI000ED49E83|nr:cellulose biosynthesis protein BcsG [Pulveribacter sp.]HCL86093.1 cellulose biosynthesis protein BcsG [Comamonadaceae bacterium]
MSYWSFYFLAKVVLHYRGYIGFHWLANLLLALALLVPLPSRPLRVLRQVLAWPAALALLYYDSYLPSLERVLSQKQALSAFSLDYMAELLARVWDWKIVLGLAALLALYGLLARRIRFSTFALLGILSVPLAAALAPQPGVPMATAGRAAAPGDAAAATLTTAADPQSQLQAFYASESTRRLDWGTAAAQPGFDIIVLHVCSLSWDDLDFVGMRDHPLFKRFDAVFSQFNTAASYSGPAMLRILRGNCGQPPHTALYEGADPSCYVFPSLERLGYQTQALLNHDGHFDDFAKTLQGVGGLAGKLQPPDGAPVKMHSFDGTPIYGDLALLSRWWQGRQGAEQPAALYYNTISLHDGNRVPGLASRRSLDTYKPRLTQLLADFDQFITELESSGRPAVVLLVPEHGAALRGDKLQISGLREIPTPLITLAPAALKVVGAPKAFTGTGGPLVVSQPTSYVGLNALLGDLLHDSPFAPAARPLAERMGQVQTTAYVAENGDMVMLRDAAGQYRMRTDKGVWIPYTP